jgi:hypothetical protein
MSFGSDFYTHLNDSVDIEVYPLNLPQGTPLPAIVYTPLIFKRNGDSNLSESNIVDRRFNIYVVADNPKSLMEYTEIVQDLYEGFSGSMGATTIMISRINNSVSLYNATQQTYECNVDTSFMVLKPTQ